MSRIIIAANRLPVNVSKRKSEFTVSPSPGGLATGLSSLSGNWNLQWVGWPGLAVKDPKERVAIEGKLDENHHPVFMSKVEVHNFYEGFSNETLWPLFHCFSETAIYSKKYWDYYKLINERFCEKILEVAQDGDIVWVHDYHLMLVPRLLKDKNPDLRIGFFLHIPFPSYELFRSLPWRAEILNGLLGADLIGFHTYEYMRHFNSSVYRILGIETKLGEIKTDKLKTNVDSFPMGINYDKFHNSRLDRRVVKQVKKFKEKFGSFKLILSVDRLDYTKGILHRLRAFKELLEQNPELRGKMSLIMVVVPSRDKVPRYKELKENVDEIVGNINGKYGSLEWTPIHYLYRSLPFNQLIALYNMCDVGLVTPLRDGMNLVAKEYIASKHGHPGILILSEMAGSSIEMEGALKVNPNNQEEIVNALKESFYMSEDEQNERIWKMQKALKQNTVEKWADNFINRLTEIIESKDKNACNLIDKKRISEIISVFSAALKPVVILDYDGTLVPFTENPDKAVPSNEILGILKELAKKARVIVISGRDHESLDKWLGHLNLELIAEHGLWHKTDNQWERVIEVDENWKKELEPVLNNFTAKTPGSFIEHKTFSLAFHYRKTDNFLAEMRIHQLTGTISGFCDSNDLDILKGNKVLEIRSKNVNKGIAVNKLLKGYDHDFRIVLGDDKTDEDMFLVMPEDSYTIKVGDAETAARFRIENCKKVEELLTGLSAAERSAPASLLTA